MSQPVPALVVATIALLAASGCGGSSGASHSSTDPGLRPPLHLTVAGRFSVVITQDAIDPARSAGVDLASVVTQDLLTVQRLLPGPPTSVLVRLDPNVIPDPGIAGVTSPITGAVRVSYWTLSRIPLQQTLGFYLARDIAHELDHSVRVLAGAGYGDTLLAAMVSEGMAEAFSNDAVPGPEVPWDHALDAGAEAALWARAQPLLETHAGATWLFGGLEIPRWTGYTIGYHLVRAYQRAHPGVDHAALARLQPEDVLAGSGYAGHVSN